MEEEKEEEEMKIRIDLDTDKFDFSAVPVAFAGIRREELLYFFSQAAGWLSELRRGPQDWSPLQNPAPPKLYGTVVGSVHILPDVDEHKFVPSGKRYPANLYCRICAASETDHRS